MSTINGGWREVLRQLRQLLESGQENYLCQALAEIRKTPGLQGPCGDVEEIVHEGMRGFERYSLGTLLDHETRHRYLHESTPFRRESHAAREITVRCRLAWVDKTEYRPANGVH